MSIGSRSFGGLAFLLAVGLIVDGVLSLFLFKELGLPKDAAAVSADSCSRPCPYSSWTSA